MNFLYFITGLLLGSATIAAVLFATISPQLKNLQKQLWQRENELKELRDFADAERVKKIQAETQLMESQKNLAEQKQLLDEASKKLSDTFSALSKNSLSSNNQMFMDLAKTTLEKMMVEFKSDTGKKHEAIENVVKPLQESLNKFQEHTRHLEENRQKDQGGLENQIKSMITAHQTLQKETNNLVNALKTPNVRGRWGEITLKRVVELAGMAEHCDFYEQKALETENGGLRPDMIVNLPNGHIIIVDSKTPLQAYIEALSANSDEERLECMRRHAQQVSLHMRQLSKKAYWDQFAKTPEMVVMFIPGESFFSAAVDINKNLIEEGMQARVILSSPTTLIALLRAIAYGWRQEQLTKNALTIQELGNTIYERLAGFLQHFCQVRKSLDGAVEAYNKSVGTLETRVLVTARRFKELGIVEKEPLREPEPVSRIPRSMEESGIC